jgi:hypothetical protein
LGEIHCRNGRPGWGKSSLFSPETHTFSLETWVYYCFCPKNLFSLQKCIFLLNTPAFSSHGHFMPVFSTLAFSLLFYLLFHFFVHILFYLFSLSAFQILTQMTSGEISPFCRGGGGCIFNTLYTPVDKGRSQTRSRPMCHPCAG